LQRLQLICAVIEKRLQLPLWNKDVYLNVVGGLRVSEPSADLAVAMSIISSTLEEPIHYKTAFIGEIGESLSGHFVVSLLQSLTGYSFFLSQHNVFFRSRW
jgi:predicted ATP-dependent serine protease